MRHKGNGKLDVKDMSWNRVGLKKIHELVVWSVTRGNS